ncbi:dihydroneopterin aldolase [Bacillus sp. FSL W8-1127]|uniref:dihydroneopterin aldolase n=1 Tax=Bacillus sp. FSL W8-1127 TaxID=2954710 RepID=UPI0030F53539
MDKVILNGMEFYAYHGVYPEENRLGQRFEVDAELRLSLKKAGETDDLTQSVNYAEVYTVCKEIMEKQTFRLVETAAETIARQILEKFPIVNECTIKVVKPNPPIPGHYNYVAVEITRGRENHE